MRDPKKESNLHASMAGFYRYLKVAYGFPEAHLQGIIASTGMILRRINGLTLTTADQSRIRAHLQGIGLRGETINLYVRSFIYYVTYLEQKRLKSS